MSRSSWKGKYMDSFLYNPSFLKKFKKKKVKIWSRRSTILPEFIGITVGIYNGRKFNYVHITENMVGHKFGEFSSTRKLGKIHNVSKKKSK
uniref:ribosomal protein S19 n=1 Tax=Meteora sporadica TaxID=2913902 RepID=UPI0030025FCA|nr:ribosomal protein S19 [Meteora sporadica]WVH37091.1 ribosomal protein S19 [Meteora sporadica]